MEYKIKITGEGEAADIIDALENVIEEIQVAEDMDALIVGVYEASLLTITIKKMK